ncbi:MAG: tRNA adenosine(34) deaminase TadA [Calditrichia bacterium]|nr:tRNA adenosine(34) deaminase TadA [Calditrichia bacterium]
MEENILSDEFWMNMAFKEAEKAYQLDEVPIGAIIIKNNEILGKGYNLTEKLQDPTAHAEMIAITAAAEKLESRRLLECTLYVTIEPCVMCAGAIVLARISRLVFGAYDPKAGAVSSLYNICNDVRLNHRVEVVQGILENKCGFIMSDFFKKLRDTN